MLAALQRPSIVPDDLEQSHQKPRRHTMTLLLSLLRMRQLTR
jgi:hypothetical protein